LQISTAIYIPLNFKQSLASSDEKISEVWTLWSAHPDHNKKAEWSGWPRFGWGWMSDTRRESICISIEMYFSAWDAFKTQHPVFKISYALGSRSKLKKSCIYDGLNCRWFCCLKSARRYSIRIM
jgi:hypothetical protein